MALNANDILDKMINAAKKSLGKNWSGINDAATLEFKKLAKNIVDIEKMNIEGSIAMDQAQLQLSFQINSVKTVMLTVVGLGILAVEAALNAALSVVSGAVNKAIGWTLL